MVTQTVFIIVTLFSVAKTQEKTTIELFADDEDYSMNLTHWVEAVPNQFAPPMFEDGDSNIYLFFETALAKKNGTFAIGWSIVQGYAFEEVDPE